MEKCKFCESAIKATQNQINLSYIVECPKCGYYTITDTALTTSLQNTPPEEKILFSAHLRNHSTSENNILITSETLNKISQTVAPYKKMPILDKINKVIIFIGMMTGSIGNNVELDYEITYPLFYCKNQYDLNDIISHLKDAGIIHGSFAMRACTCRLTIPGWQRFEQLHQQNHESKQAFVAMNFDSSCESIYNDAIAPAVNECGFVPLRIDKVDHNEKICDKIIIAIKQSRFIVADFTGQKHGVYFESGYARGLGLEVIWCCKKSELDDLHFDTRQYNHIVWENLEDLKEQLIDRIKVTIT